MAKNDQDHRRDEKVGYARPPSEHQIKRGEKRNPWGRKGKPGSKPDFMDALIEIRLDGKCCKITRAEALDHGLFKEAVKGNVSAARELERRRSQRDRTANASTANALSSGEQAALDRLIERRLAEAKVGATTTSAGDTVERLRKASCEIAPGCKK